LADQGYLGSVYTTPFPTENIKLFMRFGCSFKGTLHPYALSFISLETQSYF